MIEINAPLANCGSQSEFVEKAVRFYDGYLKAQNASAFLPHAVADVLEGTLGVFANRMAKLLFNLAVEKYAFGSRRKRRKWSNRTWLWATAAARVNS